MNCPQCKTANAPDAAFCSACGSRLAPDAAAPQPGGYPAQGAGTPLGYSAQSTPPGGQPGVPLGFNPAGPQPPAGVAPISIDLSRLTSVDKLVAGATLIGMISIWLPWYTVSLAGLGDYSFSGTRGHGWLWLEFVVALVLLAYLFMRAAWAQAPVQLPVAHAPLLIIGTGVQLLLLLIAFVDIPYGGQGMGLGWAAFIGIIAGLAAAGPVIVPAVRTYLDSRKPSAGGPGQY